MNTQELIDQACPLIRDLGWAYFFVPETEAKGKELGLDVFQFYVLGRGGVLGNVEASVVASAFGYFNPSMIQQLWDSGRQLIEPRDAVLQPGRSTMRPTPPASPSTRGSGRSLWSTTRPVGPCSCCPSCASSVAAPICWRSGPKGSTPGPPADGRCHGTRAGRTAAAWPDRPSRRPEAPPGTPRRGGGRWGRPHR